MNIITKDSITYLSEKGDKLDHLLTYSSHTTHMLIKLNELLILCIGLWHPLAQQLIFQIYNTWLEVNILILNSYLFGIQYFFSLIILRTILFSCSCIYCQCQISIIGIFFNFYFFQITAQTTIIYTPVLLGSTYWFIGQIVTFIFL